MASRYCAAVDEARAGSCPSSSMAVYAQCLSRWDVSRPRFATATAGDCFVRASQTASEHKRRRILGYESLLSVKREDIRIELLLR